VKAPDTARAQSKTHFAKNAPNNETPKPSNKRTKHPSNRKNNKIKQKHKDKAPRKHNKQQTAEKGWETSIQQISPPLPPRH
jgi:hypothetical protein